MPFDPADILKYLEILKPILDGLGGVFGSDNADELRLKFPRDVRGRPVRRSQLDRA